MQSAWGAKSGGDLCLSEFLPCVCLQNCRLFFCISSTQWWMCTAVFTLLWQIFQGQWPSAHESGSKLLMMLVRMDKCTPWNLHQIQRKCNHYRKKIKLLCAECNVFLHLKRQSEFHMWTVSSDSSQNCILTVYPTCAGLCEYLFLSKNNIQMSSLVLCSAVYLILFVSLKDL